MTSKTLIFHLPLFLLYKIFAHSMYGENTILQHFVAKNMLHQIYLNTLDIRYVHRKPNTTKSFSALITVKLSECHIIQMSE